MFYIISTHRILIMNLVLIIYILSVWSAIDMGMINVYLNK